MPIESAMRKGYSTQEIADLLDLTETTIRHYARVGVLSPQRRKSTYEFTFQDIIVLRTAKALQEAGIRTSKIHRILLVLKDSLAGHRPLASLRIEGVGNREVVIHDEDGLINPESGQLHMNFALLRQEDIVRQLVRPVSEENFTADEWFDLALDLESISPQEAPAAYLRALKLDPEHADAHVNLGRLLQEKEDMETAERHYLAALHIEPDNVLAAFNLGTLYEDMGRLHEAIKTYHRAASFADAHFNLSRLYEIIGKPAEALRHLKVYRALTDPHA